MWNIWTQLSSEMKAAVVGAVIAGVFTVFGIAIDRFMQRKKRIKVLFGPPAKVYRKSDTPQQAMTQPKKIYVGVYVQMYNPSSVPAALRDMKVQFCRHVRFMGINFSRKVFIEQAVATHRTEYPGQCVKVEELNLAPATLVGQGALVLMTTEMFEQLVRERAYSVYFNGLQLRRRWFPYPSAQTRIVVYVSEVDTSNMQDAPEVEEVP